MFGRIFGFAERAQNLFARRFPAGARRGRFHRQTDFPGLGFAVGEMQKPRGFVQLIEGIVWCFERADTAFGFEFQTHPGRVIARATKECVEIFFPLPVFEFGAVEQHHAGSETVSGFGIGPRHNRMISHVALQKQRRVAAVLLDFPRHGEHIGVDEQSAALISHQLRRQKARQGERLGRIGAKPRARRAALVELAVPLGQNGLGFKLEKLNIEGVGPRRGAAQRKFGELGADPLVLVGVNPDGRFHNRGRFRIKFAFWYNSVLAALLVLQRGFVILNPATEFMQIFYAAKYRLPTLRANSIQMFRTCEAFAKNGAVVHLLAEHRDLKPSQQASPRRWPLEKTDYHGVEPLYHLVHPRHLWWHWLGQDASKTSFARSSLDYVTRHNALDALIYTRIPLIANLAAARGLNAVLEVHNIDILQDANWQQLQPFLSENQTETKAFLGVVAISQTLADELTSHGLPAARILVAHDGIDLERFAEPISPQAAREKLRRLDASIAPGDGEFVVGYCGHLYVGRGIEMLIECARRRPQWKFLMIGGIDKHVAKYRALAGEKKVNNMIFTGHINNSALSHYLWSCDALTMPYENARDHSGFMSPMKMFEYMASGRAIVSADWPQIREVLRDGQNALLHGRGDVDELENALHRLANDPLLRDQLAHNALQDVGNYTWDERARRILEWLKVRLNQPL